MNRRRKVELIAALVWGVPDALVTVREDRGRVLVVVTHPAREDALMGSTCLAENANDVTEDAALDRLAAKLVDIANVTMRGMLERAAAMETAARDLRAVAAERHSGIDSARAIVRGETPA